MFAVVQFSKFATHHVRQAKSIDLKPTGVGIGHTGSCVAAAWVGLFTSLTVLGKVPLGTLESRWIVFVMAAISDTLLGFDAAATGHNPLKGRCQRIRAASAR